MVPLPDLVSVSRVLSSSCGAVSTFLLALISAPVYEQWVTASDDAERQSLLSLIPFGSGQMICLVISTLLGIIFFALEKFLRKKEPNSKVDDQLLIGQFAAISQRLAEGVSMTRGDRTAALGELRSDILNNLVIACREIADPRAVFYELNSAKTELQVKKETGSRPTTGPFKRGDARGDAAINFVLNNPAGHSKLIPNVKKEQLPGWAGSGNGYETYISTVVGNAQGPIGMLAIDAKEAGTLTSADEKFATLAAGLLAIAYTPLR